MTKQAKESVLERDQRDNVEIFIAEMWRWLDVDAWKVGGRGRGRNYKKVSSSSFGWQESKIFSVTCHFLEAGSLD